MTIILFLIILSVLVVAHELGHFLAARYFKMRVDEFGLGFPPRAKKLFSRNGTDFTLNWLPFGGFVRIHGEDPNSEEAKDSDSFNAKSFWSQIVVLFAGVIFNFLFAWLVFSIMLMLGIEGETGFVQRGFLGGVWHGLLTTGKITGLTLAAIWNLFAGIFRGAPDFSSVVGPVGLVNIVGQVRTMGLSYILYFVGLISVNLSIINLIPIPALDGGRILVSIIEKVRGKRLSPKTWSIMSMISFGFLILLMIAITFRDVRHVFGL